MTKDPAMPVEIEEVVARAIYEATHAGLSNCYAWSDEWEPHQEPTRGRYYKEARAAIAAANIPHLMREIERKDSLASELGSALRWLRAWWEPGSNHDTDEVQRGLAAADAALAALSPETQEGRT